MLDVGVNCYLSRADAEAYLEDALHAATWNAADGLTKDQSLVTATRMLDRQQWVGDKTTDIQTLQWPRTGVTDRDGVAVPSDVSPQFIFDATCELAVAILDDLAVQSSADSSTNIRSLEAGSARIEYFVGKSGPRFPTIVHELINYYLANASNYSGPFISGTDAESGLDDFSLNGSF